MTLDVHNQLLGRSKREHGAAFDALLASARSTLYGPAAQPPISAHLRAHLDKTSSARPSLALVGNA